MGKSENNLFFGNYCSLRSLCPIVNKDKNILLIKLFVRTFKSRGDVKFMVATFKRTAITVIEFIPYLY